MGFLSARLSTRRRHRFAGLVVVLLGLLVSGGAYSLLAPANADTASDQSDLVSRGRELFVVNCASCHGKDAQGIQQRDGGIYGPPLIGVGAAAVDFQVGTGRMPAAVPGAQIEQKPRIMDAEETRALAAYIASLAPGPAIPTKQQYDPSGLTDAEVTDGGELFRTNCTACHNFGGAGGALPSGRYAPSLEGVAPKHIYEAMLTGPQQMPVFSDGVMTPKDKREIIGYVVDQTTAPSYGGSALGSLGPVAEGLWGWLVGIGGLVLVAVWIGAAGVKVRKR